MMRKLPLVAYAVFFLLSACYSGKETSKEGVPFIEGTWEMTRAVDNTKSFVEAWTKENDSSFTGIGYILNSETGDRFNSEELSLNRRTGKWIYAAKPNSATWTEFPATEVSENVLTFENPLHDYPQFIQYELIAPDSLLVTIGDSTSLKNWKMFKVD